MTIMSKAHSYCNVCVRQIKDKEPREIQPRQKNKKLHPKQEKGEEMRRFPLKLINQVLIMASMQEC